FPDYFGHNWDAVYDCLTDLAGEDLSPAILAITAGNAFLQGMGAEWETGQRVFADAAVFWRERGRVLLVLLLADAPLPGTANLPPACLPQLATLGVERQITAADDRIRALNRAGEAAEALALGEALVRRFPDHPRASFVLAGVHDFQGREAEAAPLYQRALRLGLRGDDLQRSYVQYGSTLRNIGQYAEAVGVLREGQARYPDDVAIQAFLALALFSADRPAEALATALSVLTA
ncbi:MAG: tetratricopeptide repeat protein, partial [Thermomicrobiales bacterium]|nr:tetratricopeptide repeat protein [Thermomicrobiales bacterium]